MGIGLPRPVHERLSWGPCVPETDLHPGLIITPPVFNCHVEMQPCAKAKLGSPLDLPSEIWTLIPNFPAPWR